MPRAGRGKAALWFSEAAGSLKPANTNDTMTGQRQQATHGAIMQQLTWINLHEVENGDCGIVGQDLTCGAVKSPERPSDASPCPSITAFSFSHGRSDAGTALPSRCGAASHQSRLGQAQGRGAQPPGGLSVKVQAESVLMPDADSEGLRTGFRRKPDSVPMIADSG